MNISFLSILLLAAGTAMDSGRFADAAHDYELAISQMAPSGVSALDAFHARVSLSTACLQLKEFRKAEIALREIQNPESLDGREQATFENARASLDLAQGKLTAAEPRLRHAEEILEQIPGASSELAVVLNNVAAIEMRSGRYPAAYDHARRAVDLWKNSTPSGADLIRGWASLGSIQYLTGRYQDAASSLRNAISLAEVYYSPRHPLLADLLDSYAIVLVRLHLRRNAKEARLRASQIRSAANVRELPPQQTFDILETPIPGNGVRVLR
ncbi:MAG: tetratricopeptide repeat protein [Bryobacteraceae bacterium]|jgi:tetratricopeptide (TPR) repeat protein